MIGSFDNADCSFCWVHIMKQTEKTQSPLLGFRSVSSEPTASDFEPLGMGLEVVYNQDTSLYQALGLFKNR